MLMLIVQIVFGIYLKFHITKGFHGKIRKVAVVGHGIVGKLMPVVAWVQMLFGGITALGYCRDDHLGQCLAHFIMGSAFIGYGIVLTIIMLVGQAWLKRTGRSQEFFDSLLIAAWGCVNTFTEHSWGGAWVGNDIQHTTMGVIWWCAGLAGNRTTSLPSRRIRSFSCITSSGCPTNFPIRSTSSRTDTPLPTPKLIVSPFARFERASRPESLARCRSQT